MKVDYPSILGHTLTPTQASLVEDLSGKRFIEGPAGCGKTTAALALILSLVDSGVPAGEILLLVPQRTLALPYLHILRNPAFPAGRVLEVHTLGSLTRRMLQLFWPVVAGIAGFARPDQPPSFLNLETAQYFMAHLVRPLLDEGLFSSVSLDRNRLYSQVIDNLNKSALIGFPLDQLGERLKSSWLGEPGQLRVYEDVQTCAGLFRSYCLANNLVDYSLQVEVFCKFLWQLPLSRGYLQRSFRCLVFDNPEEDAPVVHDLVAEWLPVFETALLVYDSNGGLRSFLGADPLSAHRLKPLCSRGQVWDQTLVCPDPIVDLENRLGRIFITAPGAKGAFLKVDQPGASSIKGIPGPSKTGTVAGDSGDNFRSAIEFSFHRFFPEMMDWVADQIAALVNNEGIPAGEIAVLAPYFSDALRFSLSSRLTSRGIASRSHRPSRSLRAEPVTGCLLTLAALTYSEWGVRPARSDMVNALMLAIDGLDLVRSQLLVDIVYRFRSHPPELSSFERIKSEARERISYVLGQRYEGLRLWLEQADQQPAELDVFFSRLFGELLSQPGYGFHRNYDAGRVTASLIDSVRTFRQAVGPVLQKEGRPLGKEYLQTLEEGVIASQYIRGWHVADPQAVLLAPAHTFLMSNRPVDVQFWLDIGSRGWAERVYQPLTHPYVLSRNWETGHVWRDADEILTQELTLQNLVLGLVRRSRKAIYLGLSDLSEQGYEQRGPLLRTFNRLLTTP
ncbi:MAG: hypothetical protein A2Z16_08145 [Chloroflexi bacterium RBG_16_54_18]|nr:MAG: hypothetical protein A2Z16_08145 [Chloroflexi bacterium RBG_16_54_18]